MMILLFITLIHFTKKNLLPKYVRLNQITLLYLYQVFGKKQDPNRIIPFIIQSCLRNQSFPCSDGKQYRDLIDVDQSVTVFVKIFKSKKVLGEIINIGSGKTIKIKKLIKTVSKLTKKGKPEFGKIKMRKEEYIKLYPNLSKAKKLLNWKPKDNFTEKLISVINYEKKIFKKQIKA